MPCPCYAMAKNWLLYPEGLVSSGMQGGFSDPLHCSQMLLNLPALFLNLPPLFLLYLSILHFLLLSLPPSGSPRSQGTWPGSPSSSNQSSVLGDGAHQLAAPTYRPPGAPAHFPCPVYLSQVRLKLQTQSLPPSHPGPSGERAFHREASGERGLLSRWL